MQVPTANLSSSQGQMTLDQRIVKVHLKCLKNQKTIATTFLFVNQINSGLELALNVDQAIIFVVIVPNFLRVMLRYRHQKQMNLPND